MRGPRPGITWVAGLSLLLHAAAAWLLLPHRPGREAGDPPPLVEVELVQQAAQLKGGPPAPAPPAPPPTPPAPPLSAPPDPVAQLPAPQAAQPSLAPSLADVNLGGAEQDQDNLAVTGRNILPARPDSRFRNKPPGYPADAARRHVQGIVGLRVHVTELGTAAWVDVVSSSGDASLDRSAREALALWRFRPAHAGQRAVPFDFDIAINFNLGDQLGSGAGLDDLPRLDDPPRLDDLPKLDDPP